MIKGPEGHSVPCTAVKGRSVVKQGSVIIKQCMAIKGPAGSNVLSRIARRECGLGPSVHRVGGDEDESEESSASGRTNALRVVASFQPKRSVRCN